MVASFRKGAAMKLKPWSIKECFRRNARLAKLLFPEDGKQHWAAVDLDDFCGPFSYGFWDTGELEITVVKGSSPVIIPPPGRQVDAIINALQNGDYRLHPLAAGGFYSEKERDSVLQLPENEQRARVWNDYAERIHKPYLQYLQDTFGGGAPGVAAVTVTPGSNSGITKPHLAL